jgi:hypothetical protein
MTPFLQVSWDPMVVAELTAYQHYTLHQCKKYCSDSRSAHCAQCSNSETRTDGIKLFTGRIVGNLYLQVVLGYRCLL